MKSNTFLFSSEQVSGGHPDKICDYISDSILDAYLTIDSNAKVACETLIKNYHIVIAGEITSIGTINYEEVVKKALTDLGYIKENGFDHSKLDLLILIDKQSTEIANSVHTNK